MSDDNERARAIFDVMRNIVTESGQQLSLADQLFAIEGAWLVVASNARHAQLSIPGGFPAERERQAASLENFAALVRSDEPDLELERLWQEGDHEGAIQHLRRLMDEAKGGQ